MANNGKHSSTESNIGEINTIRDILMGQHINQYDSKFEEVQEEIEALKEELEEKIKAIDHFHKFAMIDYAKENNQRLNKLDKQLNKQLELIEQKIRNSSTADKKELGRMMANMGKKLMGE